jgi:hypothetical protein
MNDVKTEYMDSATIDNLIQNSHKFNSITNVNESIVSDNLINVKFKNKDDKTNINLEDSREISSFIFPL